MANKYYFGDMEADRIYCGDILFYEKKTTSYDSRLVWAIDAYRNELGKKRLVCYTKDGIYPKGWENLKYDDDGVFYDVSRSGDVNNIAGYITDDLKIYIGLPYEVGADGKPSSTGYVPQGRLKIPCEWNFETHTIIGQKLKGSGSSRLATYYGDFVQYYGLEFFDCYINGNIFKLTSGDDIYSGGFRGRHNAGGEIGYMKICTGGEVYGNVTDTFKRVLIYEGAMTEEEMQKELKKDINLNTLAGELLPVQDGLICWLDGRDGSGTDTTWIDRSGNGNDAVLENYVGAWTGTGLKGNGNNSVCTINKYMYELFSTGEMTIEMYYNADTEKESQNEYYAPFIFGQSAVFQFRFGDNGNLDVGDSQLMKLVSVEQKTGYKCVTVKNNKIYVHNNDGTIHTACTNNYQIDSNHNLLTKIGGWIYPGNLSLKSSDRTVYMFRLYNRALTEAEIVQNYEYEQSIERRVNKFVPRNDTTVLSSEILSNGDIVFTNIGGANSTRITLNGAISDGDRFSFTVIGDIPANTLFLKDGVSLESGKTYAGIVGIDSYNVQSGNFRFNFTGFPFNSTFTLRDMIVWTP